ncbi:MAG: hypothetical protein J6U23_12195 [Clostridiales bacterium]|nr:hypothetical protein [Clostridiales bacterium]
MSSSTEELIKREKMRAFKKGVIKGRDTYEDDLDELAQGLKNASSRSKIADTLYDRLIPSLNKKSISDDFDYYIKKIDWYT